MAKRAPYGTWDSPISAGSVVSTINAISDIFVDPISSRVFHVESRPSEGGRSALVDTLQLKDVLPDDMNVRNGVHEYGGGEATAHGGLITYSNYADGRVYQVRPGEGRPVAVTPQNPAHRFADFSVNPAHPHLIVAVLEDHIIDEPSAVVNSLCIINTSTKTVSPLRTGADFYAGPRFSPDGTHIVYQQWFHPDMPWEGSQIVVANFDASSAQIISERHVAGERLNISASHPSWASDDRIIYITDVSGFQNPQVYALSSKTASAVFKDPINEEFGPAALTWKLGSSPYTILSNGDYGVFSSVREGRQAIYVVDLKAVPNSPVLVDDTFALIESMRAISLSGHEVVFVGTRSDKRKSIYKGIIDLFAGSPRFRYEALNPSHEKFSPDLISVPQPFVLKPKGPDYPTHVNFYAPQNPMYASSSIEDEKPPCIVHVHGGPTRFADQCLQWGKMYYTSRGFACQNPFGRALVDRNRLIIRGVSSGGYTVLSAISRPPLDQDLNVSAAAMSSYGISDLGALMKKTHKLESRYGVKLVGGMSAMRREVDVEALYAQRSPINYADKLTTPLLLLQGDKDKVVSKEQSDSIYENLSARGACVEYKVYAGEGHGWKMEGNMRDAIEREVGFYRKGLKLGGEVEGADANHS